MTVSLTDARSAELYARALQRLPGGVNSPVRAMRAIGRDPVFVERGQGAELVDVDGNRYVDYVCSWGPLIHGHAHPDVVAAVVAAAHDGTTFGAPTFGEVALAEEVARRMPAVEMVRMTSSGTEATMSAIRLARAVTGREKLLKFAGAYHGHVDGLLAEAGSGLATRAIPASPGVTEAATAATIVVPWNDPDAVVRAAEQHELAAILAEPYPANMGLVPPAPGFLELLRERATQTGALLVFDEVITGFRVAPGGAQELTGVLPDLDGHGQGHRRRPARGGLRRAARADGAHRAGRRRLPGRHAVGQSARRRRRPGDAARCSTTPPTRRWPRRTEALAAGLREAAGDAPVQVVTAPGLLTVFFSGRAGPRLRGRAGVRPRGLRRLVPRAARPAASTRRRRSSRRGSRRWPTGPSTSSAPSRRPPRRSREAL